MILLNKQHNEAEYTMLNNRLDMYTEAQNSLFIFAFSAIGVILSFSIQQENSYIALVAFVVLICVKCRVMYYRDLYFNNINYLRTVVEPELQICSNIKRTIKDKKVSNIQYFSFSFMGIGGMITFLLNEYSCHILWLCIILFLIVIILDCYYYFGSEKIYKYYLDQYKDHQSNIKITS